MGSTIKKEVNTDNPLEGIHTRQRIIKEATGVAFMTAINGCRSCREQENQKESAAKSTPANSASTNPPTIRIKEKDTACQNARVRISVPRRKRTETGETKRISCPSAMLVSCQTTSQKTIAQTRKPVPAFAAVPFRTVNLLPSFRLSAVVERLIRQRPSDRLRILLQEYGQISA